MYDRRGTGGGRGGELGYGTVWVRGDECRDAASEGREGRVGKVGCC